MFGVLDGERSHTIAFTEQCADHYTTNTIEKLAGALGIEPKLTESKSVVLPLHNAPTIKQDSIFWLFFKKRFLMFAVAILKLVVTVGLEPTINTV